MLEAMTDERSTSAFLDETTALLERTPRVVHELLAGLPRSWLGNARHGGRVDAARRRRPSHLRRAR
jgi:hypothetical protein